MHSTLPTTFYQMFGGHHTRLAAEALQAWARFRDGRFVHGPAQGRAWRVLVPSQRGHEYILTLEPWHHTLDRSGRRRSEGSTVVDFRPMRTGYFAAPAAQVDLHRRLHDSMLPTLTFNPRKRWVSVKWPLLLQPGGLVRYLTVLDWAADCIAST